MITLLTCEALLTFTLAYTQTRTTQSELHFIFTVGGLKLNNKNVHLVSSHLCCRLGILILLDCTYTPHRGSRNMEISTHKKLHKKRFLIQSDRTRPQWSALVFHKKVLGSILSLDLWSFSGEFPCSHFHMALVWVGGESFVYEQNGEVNELMELCSMWRNKDFVPICCSEKGAELKGKAPYLLVSLHFNPHLWSWRINCDWNKELLETSSWKNL